MSGIVRSLSSAMAVEAQGGLGAAFRLYVPASDEPVQPASQEPAPGYARGHGEHVMFVDDEPTLVALGEATLRHLGYEPACFDDPRDALAAFLRDPARYAVAMTDVTMPFLGGFELVDALLATRSDLPIIMMSGNVRHEDEDHARALGVRQIVLKPVALPELARILESVLRKPATGAG